MSQILSAKDLAIAHRLEPTSLTVEKGQLVGLVGPNGSGKTSLLHALAGIPPATGDVEITGRRTGKLPPAARQRLFTFLPASRDVTWPLAARHFIELALPAGSNWSVLANRFELEPLLDRRMDRLSTGERTRVMIVRALAPNPMVLLLDEPLANLDPYWQVVLLDELQDRATRAGQTAIAAIHDLRAALDWSNRVLVMNERRLWADGAPAHLRASGQLEAVFRVGLEQL